MMKVLGQDLDVLYTLKYTKVKKVVFEFPSEEPLFYDEGDHIGDWGYDELTAADDLYLRHEVLFASGTIILVEFKHFTIQQRGMRRNTQSRAPLTTTCNERAKRSSDHSPDSQ